MFEAISDKFTESICQGGIGFQTHSFKVKGINGESHEIIYHSLDDTIQSLKQYYQSQYNIFGQIHFIFHSKPILNPHMHIGNYLKDVKPGDTVFQIARDDEMYEQQCMENLSLEGNLWKVDVILPTADMRKQTFLLNQFDRVKDLKDIIYKKTLIPQSYQCLLNDCKGYQLKDEETLLQVKKMGTDDIYLILYQRQGEINMNYEIYQFTGLKDIDDLVCIEIEGKQFYFIPMSWIKGLTCSQIIKSFINSDAQNFRLVLGPQLMQDTEKLNDLFNLCELDYLEDAVKLKLNVVDIKTYLYASASSHKTVNFMEKQYQKQMKPNEKKRKQEMKKNIDEKLLPITYYTSSVYYLFNQYLKKMDIASPTITQGQYYNLWQALILALSQLNHKKCDGITYRGDRNFTLSPCWKKGTVACNYSVLSTSLSSSMAACFKVNQQDHNHKAMIYLRSINGIKIKEYSVYPGEQEVIFPPYTYFYIDKINKVSPKLTELWYLEMPMPQTFKKNVIVWVHDSPTQCLPIATQMEKKYNIEVIFLVSPESLSAWDGQVWWLLDWKNLKYKIISSTKLKDPFDKKVENHRAALDIISLFSSRQSYRRERVEVLFNTNDNAEKQKIRNQAGSKLQFIHFGSSKEDLMQFGKFK